MLDKLRIVKQRYDEVSDLIIQPEIIMDQRRYATLMKEYKDLGIITDITSLPLFMDITDGINGVRYDERRF